MTQQRTAAHRTVVAAAVAAVIGWTGVTAIGLQLGSSGALGFDLELLLEAGRDLAQGRSPYELDLIAGGAPTATDLFYSYPPPVGQLVAPLAGLPSALALVLWNLFAVGGLLVVAEGLRRRLAPDRMPVTVLAVSAAAAPLTLPFAVGLLFGNLDVFFPVLYGVMLVAALAPTPTSSVAGGAALALAALKIHPGSMGLWFVVRALRDRASGADRVVVSGIVVALAIVAASVLLGGSSRWSEYGLVVEAGTNALIVDPRNAGIAALIAGALGHGDQLARGLHLVVGALALAMTAWAGWRRGDVIEGFAWATAASLATLPVTWYHYPAALIPVGIACWLRSGRDDARHVRVTIASAQVAAAAALVVLPMLWVAIGLVILAAHRSRPAPRPEPRPERPAPPAPGVG